MKITRTLIVVLAVLFMTLYASAQATAGGAAGARTTAGIGATGIASPDWNTNSRPNPEAELKFSDKLADKLKTLLPQDTDPHVASKGFGELKDFVATVRAANNLGVHFRELKSKMAEGTSKALEKAIHQVKPDADAKAELKKAQEQAKQDIKESKHS
jgi:hypothetical protein